MTHFERVHVIGARGRVGSAVSARLAERGVALTEDEPELVLLCVPDRAVAEVAAAVDPGPWVAHVSGATPLAALDPHTRRFGLHPLQTFTKRRGPEQLDGAFAAVTAESEDAHAAGFTLARLLGLEPFALDDARRAAYHAGAATASNFLVTLRRAGGSLLEAAGRAARGARPADAPRDRERLRADRPDRAWGLGDRRAAPGGDPAGAPRARARLPCAGRPHRRAGADSQATLCCKAGRRGLPDDRRASGRARAAASRPDRARADDGRTARRDTCRSCAPRAQSATPSS